MKINSTLKVILLAFIASLTCFLAIALPASSQNSKSNLSSFELCSQSKLENPVDSIKRLLFPDDPMLSEQWYLQEEETSGINWESIIPYEEYHRFGQGVTVAIVDDGVSFHDDLDPKLFTPGYDFSARGGQGADIRSARGSKSSSERHGTKVAAVIAQTTCNGKGTAGIAPGVKIMPIRVKEKENDKVSLGTLASGIEKAVDKGADIINVSIGFDSLSPENEKKALGNLQNALALRRLKAAIQKAYDNNVVVVMAAGNYSSSQQIPKFAIDLLNSSAVISVAAHNKENALASYSTQTEGIDISAPGGEGTECSTASETDTNTGLAIFVTDFIKGKGLQGFSCPGTSMATPQVTAAAAIVMAEFKHCPKWKTKNIFINMFPIHGRRQGFKGECPSYTVDEIRSILQNPQRILNAHHSSEYRSILGDRYIRAELKKPIPKLDVHASDFAAYEYIFHKGTPAVTATQPAASSSASEEWIIAVFGLGLLPVGFAIYAIKSMRKGNSNSSSEDVNAEQARASVKQRR